LSSIAPGAVKEKPKFGWTRRSCRARVVRWYGLQLTALVTPELLARGPLYRLRVMVTVPSESAPPAARDLSAKRRGLSSPRGTDLDAQLTAPVSTVETNSSLFASAKGLISGTLARHVENIHANQVILAGGRALPCVWFGGMLHWSASPWAEVGDQSKLRADIGLLQSAGVIEDITIQWPLPWESLRGDLSRINLGRPVLGGSLRRPARSGPGKRRHRTRQIRLVLSRRHRTGPRGVRV